jgi:hypothetical protein
VNGTGIPWWQAEPRRLERDQADIGGHFSDLTLDLTGQGRWSGRLPMWPFERPAPDGLELLLDGRGLEVVLEYRSAYPAVFPFVYPTDPVPEFETWTQARWHVLGNGALCQFQTYADWDPTRPVSDLLLRAAAWFIEYTLLKAGLIDEMTLQGIWHDDSLDHLVTQAASDPARPADRAAVGAAPDPAPASEATGSCRAGHDGEGEQP